VLDVFGVWIFVVERRRVVFDGCCHVMPFGGSGSEKEKGEMKSNMKSRNRKEPIKEPQHNDKQAPRNPKDHHKKA
jgi:hypothetical protein